MVGTPPTQQCRRLSHPLELARVPDGSNTILFKLLPIHISYYLPKLTVVLRWFMYIQTYIYTYLRTSDVIDCIILN